MGEISEPVDPAAPGVASLLKSLRTRAGLQEERLAGTELPLDALARLDRVRALEAEGEQPLPAIVRAVRTAAGLLEPTLSIVADVSLCLKLFEKVVPDPRLYGEDLRHRREALLANWSALHELRSVSPAPPAPTLRTLRLELEATALGALAAALTAPADQDLVLGQPFQQSGSEPLAGRGRVPPESEAELATSPALRLTGGQPLTVLQVFQNVARSLRNSLILDSASRPEGWPQDLRQTSQPATALSTAYGIKTLLLLQGDLAPELIPVVSYLGQMSLPGGGYATRTQNVPRPEVTATVLDALHRINGTINLDSEFKALEEDIGDFERSRPYILSTVLETSTRLQPHADFTASLVDDLLAARQQYDQYMIWPEKTEPSLAAPSASTAHTARAVWALVHAQATHPSVELQEKIQDAVEQAAVWLIERADRSNISEIIERPLDGSIERLVVRHFTAAWIIKALVSVGLPASHPTVSAAITRIWGSYHEPSALWRWPNGDVPVWMVYDAVHALHLAALAIKSRPGKAGRVMKESRAYEQ